MFVTSFSRTIIMCLATLCFFVTGIVSHADPTTDAFAAAKRGDVETLRLLLRAAPNLMNATDSREDTLLSVAVAAQHLETVRFLLESHASVNIKNKWGETPLMSAAALVRTDIVALLIAQGADVNASKKGRTALHDAAEWGRKGAAQLLLNKGADVNARTEDGTTPLHTLGSYGDGGGGEKAEMATLFLTHGGKLMARNRNGETPLHTAADGTFDTLVAVLLKHGADVNARSVDGSTPLNHAHSIHCIRLLLAHGAHVNATDNRGTTPLMEQAKYNDVATLKVFITAGAKPRIRDKAGKTAFDYAVQFHNTRVFSLLRP